MKVKIKKLNKDAHIPKSAYKGDAGVDLVATEKLVRNNYVEYKTGLSISVPENHVGLLFPRSSISNTSNMALANSTGVLDSSYSGEVCLRFRGDGEYDVGDRIGQLVIVPHIPIEFEEVEELEESDRSTGGFGSSGQSAFDAGQEFRGLDEE